MMSRVAIAAALLLLASCASPSQRISTKLTSYGVPKPQAVCMGDRLQQRLSTAQLRRLGEVGSMSRDNMGRMSVNDIARVLNQPGDEVLVSEVVRAGLGCLI